MSIKPLLDQLQRDALAERERRLEAARATALRLGVDAEHLLQRQRHDALVEREHTVRSELDRERAAVSRQCQLEQLHARRRLVERCLKATSGRTTILRETAGFADALQRQTGRALAYLPDGRRQVRCSPSIEGEMRQALWNNGAADAELTVDDACDFGFIIEADDGSVRVDATLATLIALERDVLAIEIVRRYQQGVR